MRLTDPRMVYTCDTPGRSEAWAGFTEDPDTFCSICLNDLAGVYDMSGEIVTDDEGRTSHRKGCGCPICRKRAA